MERLTLFDVDELVLCCRHETAKSYIDEAVRAYKAGAFRASIVMAWIAVVYDFVDKLRELELTGDKNAKLQLNKFEDLVQNQNYPGLLQFERELLDKARDDFELITPSEHFDLSRLREDRHRSAHPSMAGPGEKYDPTPELARLHLRNAVEHALRNPPVQGKAALDRLFADIESKYFPIDSGQAKIFLMGGPLSKPRAALVRNFAIAVLKRALVQDLTDLQCQQSVAALRATQEMHRQLVDEILQEKLSGIVANLSDSKMANALRLLGGMPDLARFIGNDVQIKLINFVGSADGNLVAKHISSLSGVSFLAAKIQARISSLSPTELVSAVVAAGTHPPDELVERAISLYENSSSFAEANSRSDLLIQMVSHLTYEHVKRVFTAAKSNDQIGESFKLSSVIAAIKNSNRVSEDEFDELLRANLQPIRGLHYLVFKPLDSEKAIMELGELPIPSTQ